MPEKDSINVGDTLTLYSKFIPTDINTGNEVPLSNGILIGSPLSVGSLKGGGIIDAAVDSFLFLPIIGLANMDINNTISKKVKQLFYGFKDGNYLLEIKIIALKKGIYTLGFLDAIFKKENTNGCNDGGFVALKNNNLNNNLIYYQTLYYQGLPVPLNDSIHGYSFKVK
ncbi:MAG: hypothetical protein LH615_13625 [Ferruginibacter sp.]|nr:hypothetical protein [Ferruginibacter sp.]